MAYLAASVASAPPKRGLALAAIAPPRNSAAAPAVAPSPVAGAGDAADDWTEAIIPSAVAAATGDDDGPPVEELEARMRMEVAASDAAQAPRKTRGRMVADEDNDSEATRPGAPLPGLDVLLGRVPAEVRETMEELLRVRFTTVKRVPSQALDPVAARKAAP
ncbi:MAG: hypothetical protein NTU80_00565 [Verrucomicrobia bacterium]|nr:hypothetical protein [Verrucomicrobiota bacterium]